MQNLVKQHKRLEFLVLSEASGSLKEESDTVFTKIILARCTVKMDWKARMEAGKLVKRQLP